jgi:hypothetical protein
MNDRPSPLDPISTLALSMPDPMLPSSRPASPAVSVVICAYTLDRWDDTLAAIRSVLGQTLPPEQVIVVSDHNPQLFDRSSRTRNSAACRARGTPAWALPRRASWRSSTTMPLRSRGGLSS